MTKRKAAIAPAYDKKNIKLFLKKIVKNTGGKKTNSKQNTLSKYDFLDNFSKSEKKSYKLSETPIKELTSAAKENKDITYKIKTLLLPIKIISFSAGLPYPNNVCINKLLLILNKKVYIKYCQKIYTKNGIKLPKNITKIIILELLNKYVFNDGINKLYPNDVKIIGKEKIPKFFSKKLKLLIAKSNVTIKLKVNITYKNTNNIKKNLFI